MALARKEIDLNTSTSNQKLGEGSTKKKQAVRVIDEGDEIGAEGKEAMRRAESDLRRI